MADPSLMALARRLKNLEHNVRQTKQPNLGFSTMDGGAIQATNGVDETLTMVMGEQYDGTNAAVSMSGPTPPTPSQAGVFSAPGAIRVYWDGTFLGDNVAPMDWARVTVHIVPVAEYDPGTFTPLDQSQIYGSFESARGGEISPILEQGDYIVVLTAWSLSGKFSAPSIEAFGAVEPIVVETGPDGLVPATAPTVLWAGGIGSVFYRWNPVANADPTEYALYVRAGEPPTTLDDTYLVAAGNIQQATIRQALGPDPDDPEGPEIVSAVTPGVDYYGVVVAYDEDGQGPDSLPAIAQSVQINSPDIATDAIATRHLQADSVGVDQIMAGSIDANKLAARLILASEMLLGKLDNSGLDPNSMSPNILPSLATSTASGAIVAGTWLRGSSGSPANGAGWTAAAEEFQPVNDDAYWERMAPGSLQALRLDFTAHNLPGTSTWQARTYDTVVTVEPLTEYRFEFNSACPGANPNMAATGLDTSAVNTVKWYASIDGSFQDSEIVSWKGNSKEARPRPELTQFDRGIIRTGASQTQLYLRMEVRATHTVAGAGGFVIVMPELRKIESTTVLSPVANPSSVTSTDAVADPASTTWKASAVWSGTTSGITRSSETTLAASSNGVFGPSKFSTPGRYATPGESQDFQWTKGIKIVTQSGGSGLGLRARIVAPALSVPALSPMESLFVSVGFGGLTTAADGLDDYTFTASWYDASNALISHQAVIDLDTALIAVQGITNLTENFFNLQLAPPAGAQKVVFWSEFSNGPAGSIAASASQQPTMHGLRLYTLESINYNYGNMAAQHVEMDTNGVRLVNARGQLQVDLPTDENAVPFFRGGGEFGSLRVTGGMSIEGQSEVAKDASISLSDGIKSPVGIPILTQEYDQYTLQRQPPNGQFPGFSTKPTLNPAEITGMVWKSTWGEFWLMENRGGGAAVWRFGTDGSCKWASLQNGWSNAVPLDDPRTTNNLFAGEFGGNHWAYVYNGSTTVLNRIPDNTVPAGVEPIYIWGASNNRLYIHYPHTDGSGRHVYKRLAINNTSGGNMTVETVTVSGSGTSRTSATTGLAGVATPDTTTYTAARGTTSADTYAFAGGDGAALNVGARFPLASPPMGFCSDGNNFWQVDTAGKFTKYSDWTWTQTDHKIYAGLTWFDSDTGGTGIHETDLTKLASATLKKRISGIRVTLPPVPDKGGADDPDRWRLYAAKASSLSLPANRTSMFLQSQGGLPTQQTTYVIPANGLITSGTNPPLTNNFPSASPGRIYSAAVEVSSAPKIELKGDGSGKAGDLSWNTSGVLAYKGDTAWANLTVAANWTGTAQWRIYNKSVRLHVAVEWTGSNVASSSNGQIANQTICTLPSGARPEFSRYFPAGFVGGLVSNVFVQNDGIVALAAIAPNVAALAATHNVALDCEFPLP